MRILHLSHDNTFVARFSHLLEEVAPESSHYVILASSGELTHPIAAEHSVARTVVEAQQRMRELAAGAEVLLVHYMFPSWAGIVADLPPHLTVVWCGFGGDYAGTLRDPNAGLLAPLTSELQGRIAEPLTMRGRALRARRAWLGRNNGRNLRAASERARFFSAPVRADLGVFTARFPGFTGEFVQLNYGTAEELAPTRSTPIGEHVLVGNSATLPNNHLDVFARLSGLRSDGRKVIVPLSYGEPAAYREAVLAAGARLFGSDFVPVLDHLPLHEYQELVSSCEFVLMGHRRQQGLGNVLTALLGGATVLLDRLNPVFTELSAAGAHVGDLYNPAAVSLEQYRGDAEQQAANGALIRRLWGRAQVFENLRIALRAFSSAGVNRADDAGTPRSRS